MAEVADQGGRVVALPDDVVGDRVAERRVGLDAVEPGHGAGDDQRWRPTWPPGCGRCRVRRRRRRRPRTGPGAARRRCRRRSRPGTARRWPGRTGRVDGAQVGVDPRDQLVDVEALPLGRPQLGLLVDPVGEPRATVAVVAGVRHDGDQPAAGRGGGDLARPQPVVGSAAGAVEEVEGRVAATAVVVRPGSSTLTRTGRSSAAVATTSRTRRSPSALGRHDPDPVGVPEGRRVRGGRCGRRRQRPARRRARGPGRAPRPARWPGGREGGVVVASLRQRRRRRQDTRARAHPAVGMSITAASLSALPLSPFTFS